MPDVLPEPPGLDIETVIYSYTIRKQTEDQVDVYVGNENANGTGYIFREHDEWRPGSLDGTQINKVVGVGSVHRDLWGDGFIDVEGNGSVEDANLIYNYRVDPCYDPQFDPNCPGYEIPKIDIPEFDIADLYDAKANGDADQEEWDPNDERFYDEEEGLSEEELAEREGEEEKDSKERLEKALAAADNSALFAQALAKSQVLDTINQATNMNSYYAQSIDGGSYSDSVQLTDSQLPDNRRGLRNNLAQQILHQQMVDSQYKK